MRIFSVLSHLLDYPTVELQKHHDDLVEIIQNSTLSDQNKNNLVQLCLNVNTDDLLGRQAEYDELFDRGRSHSLLIFEHIHGESRDRGQAMVDLVNQYQQAGLMLNKNELPDHLPLYLEFLATQGEINGPLGLVEIAHVLALLFCRLEKRDSDYRFIFAALIELSGISVDLTDLRKQMQDEVPDYTDKAIDAVWEEEQVTFGATDSDACDTNNKPTSQQSKADFVPVSWTTNTAQPFNSEQ
ncbi:nitrate reductase molybdenum cofactor assembly chaperone [Reinekea sp.]|jgi:nitrate reductase delta subunit|uniref:nitrate reductase molybdenum cofactor assembly chaperone n=1 Tax=Reinekea sp. TaxID=1970455 RepID=UPI00398A0F88